MCVSPHRWFPWQVVVEVPTMFAVYTVCVVFTDTLPMDLNNHNSLFIIMIIIIGSFIELK